jgi:hypothetical protein
MLADVPINRSKGSRSGRTWIRLDRHAVQAALLAALLLVCYSLFRQVPAWNEWSRYALVRALVEDGTVRIDPYHENTGDKAFRDGHFYSDKMPGSSLMGVPVYVLVRGVAALQGMALDPEHGLYALTLAVSGLPTIITTLLLLGMLRSLTDERWALLVATAYALGTIAFPFATMYFGHAASACWLFGAFYILWRWSQDTRRRFLLVAGFTAGWAVLTEIPVVLGAAILLGYALHLHGRRALWFVLGGVPPLLILLAYNVIAFEHPLRLGYQFTTNFAEQNSRGIVSVVLPSWSVAIDLLVGPRGLLRLSPWLGLAPCGLWALRRTGHRALILVCTLVVAAFLAYNSGALNPFGGWTPGPRYLVPALPFAAMLVAFAPRAFRPLLLLLAAFSILLVLVATATMPNAPEEYADPLGDLWLPRLASGDLATTVLGQGGAHGITPLLFLGGAMLASFVALWFSTRRAHSPPLG